jgi:hypothetical protein
LQALQLVASGVVQLVGDVEAVAHDDVSVVVEVVTNDVDAIVRI